MRPDASQDGIDAVDALRKPKRRKKAFRASGSPYLEVLPTALVPENMFNRRLRGVYATRVQNICCRGPLGGVPRLVRVYAAPAYLASS